MEGEVGEREGEGSASPSWSSCLAAPVAGRAPCGIRAESSSSQAWELSLGLSQSEQSLRVPICKV